MLVALRLTKRKMNMDLTESIAPKSDQLDAIELVSGPRIFTIERVSTHNAEQPFNFHLEGFPRVWRPGKSMRRVIVAAWGSSADKYAGQRVELFCDNSVDFGGVAVGGTRISRMSGIDKPLKVPLLIKRGKSAVFTVQPLADSTPTSPAIDNATLAEWIDQLANAETVSALQGIWGDAGRAGVSAHPAIVAAKDQRKGELA
jgi:hypothetical protein